MVIRIKEKYVYTLIDTNTGMRYVFTINELKLEISSVHNSNPANVFSYKGQSALDIWGQLLGLEDGNLQFKNWINEVSQTIQKKIEKKVEAPPIKLEM